MIFLLPIFPRHFHDIPSDTRINTAIYTIIKTETLTVNNLSFKNKNYPYLQTLRVLECNFQADQFLGKFETINCSNLLLTAERFLRKSSLTAKKHPLQKFTCSKLFNLHLLHCRKPYNWMNAKSLSRNFIAFILKKVIIIITIKQKKLRK